MKIVSRQVPASDLADDLRASLHAGKRLGTLTTIDGKQLATVVLDPAAGSGECWITPLTGANFHSLTSVVPQCHWFERVLCENFGVIPEGHPRLKPVEVVGAGTFEVPVGPIHAGIIEPGHFRFNCLGEIVVNLGIGLGYVHRGVEKRLTEVPWRKARFVAEAAASDSAAAYALAHAVAIESLAEVEVSSRAQFLRALAIEIERVCMHTADLSGIAGDIGFLAVASSLSRLRGSALGLADSLAKSRFLRSFIKPGGVTHDPEGKLGRMSQDAKNLAKDVASALYYLFDNPVVIDRMQNIGRLSPNLASDFGIVGPAARASGVEYDCRAHFDHAVYPAVKPSVSVERNGDVLARARVREREIQASLEFITRLIETMPGGPTEVALPQALRPDSMALGIVEAHRGELVHLVVTDEHGMIKRYAIKDPSVNNWTALAIVIRNNLLADFPLCNKSFSLSYSGHDL
jgi:Ni,Fe-hydrogenase III large subunit